MLYLPVTKVNRSLSRIDLRAVTLRLTDLSNSILIRIGVYAYVIATLVILLLPILITYYLLRSNPTFKRSSLVTLPR